jgi:hypothetical protein
LDIAREFLEKHNDILFCFTDFRSDHHGAIVERALRSWYRDPRGWDEIIGPGAPFSAACRPLPGWDDFLCYAGNVYAKVLESCFICTITVTVRREEAGPALQFAEDLPTYEDWWCFALLARQGYGAYLDCETAIQHCHKAPRLTDADTLTCAETRLRVLEAIWGSDREFLQTQQELYDRAVLDQRIHRAKGLIKVGRVRQARSELASIAGVPAAYRLLTILPGPVTAGLFTLRSRFQTLQHGLKASVSLPGAASR